MSNIGPPVPGIGRVYRSAKEEFDAFNQLPPHIRHLLNIAPIKLDAPTFLEGCRRKGVEAMEWGFWAVMKQHLPDWTPLAVEDSQS